VSLSLSLGENLITFDGKTFSGPFQHHTSNIWARGRGRDIGMEEEEGRAIYIRMKEDRGRGRKKEEEGGRRRKRAEEGGRGRKREEKGGRKIGRVRGTMEREGER
jgi:hypothetical protein